MYSHRNGNCGANRSRSPVRKIMRNRLENRNPELQQTNNDLTCEIQTWKKRKKMDYTNGSFDNNEFSTNGSFEIDQNQQSSGFNGHPYSPQIDTESVESTSSIYNSSSTTTVSDSVPSINCEYMFTEYCKILELNFEVNPFFKTEKQVKLTSYVIEFYNGSFFWSQVTGEYIKDENVAKEQAFAVGCNALIGKFGAELASSFGPELLRSRRRQPSLEYYWNPWTIFFIPPPPPPPPPPPLLPNSNEDIPIPPPLPLPSGPVISNNVTSPASSACLSSPPTMYKFKG